MTILWYFGMPHELEKRPTMDNVPELLAKYLNSFFSPFSTLYVPSVPSQYDRMFQCDSCWKYVESWRRHVNARLFHTVRRQKVYLRTLEIPCVNAEMIVSKREQAEKYSQSWRIPFEVPQPITMLCLSNFCHLQKRHFIEIPSDIADGAVMKGS